MSRIVLVVSSVGGGGAERQAAILFRQLEAEECLLVSLEDDLSFLGEGASRVVTLSKHSRWDFFRVVKAVHGILRPSDVVVAFNWYPNVISWLARRSGPRIVRYGAPVERDIPPGLGRILARYAHRSASAVVGLTWGLTRDACMMLGPPREACAAIPNAVDPPSADGGIEAGDRYIAVLSRLGNEKGVDRAIRAFKCISDQTPLSLHIAGAGPERDALEDLAKRLGVGGRVFFEGHLRDPGNFLTRAALLLVGSRWEGFGSSIIEAMSYGVPVVAMDVPYGPREIIGGTHGGILVADGDIEEMGAGALRLLDDHRMWAAMSRAGMSVVSTYGPESMARSYLALVEGAVASGGPSSARAKVSRGESE